MVTIQIDKASMVASIYDGVKQYSNHPSDFDRFTPCQCSYYKLKTFVPLTDLIDQATLDRCKDKSNWEEMRKRDRVWKTFIEDPQDEYINVILLFPTSQFSACQCEHVLKISYR